MPVAYFFFFFCNWSWYNSKLVMIKSVTFQLELSQFNDIISIGSEPANSILGYIKLLIHIDAISTRLSFGCMFSNISVNILRLCTNWFKICLNFLGFCMCGGYLVYDKLYFSMQEYFINTLFNCLYKSEQSHLWEGCL